MSFLIEKNRKGRKGYFTEIDLSEDLSMGFLHAL